MMRISLFRKFLLVFLLTGAVALAFSSLLLRNELEKELLVRIEEELTAAGGIIAAMPVAEIKAKAGQLSRLSQARLTLIDARGTVLADTLSMPSSMENHLNRSEIQEARLKGTGSASRYSRTLKQEMFYVAVPLGERTGKTGYVRLARPVAEASLFADEKGRMLLLIIFSVASLYFLIAACLFARLLAPIRRLILFTGRVRAGDFSGSLLVKSRDEIGKLIENINQMVDELREKIKKADEERQKLESVFSGMKEGVMLLDAEGRVESLNRSMEGMLMLHPEEAIGKTIMVVCRNAGLHDALKRARETRESVCEDIVIGDEHPAVINVTIAAGEQGGAEKTILVFHDVTRLKGLERIRTDFIANVTHEIRTPLTAIIGFAETLQQGALENREVADRFLATIRENAERLNRLVDDLTTLSVLELQEARLQLEEVSLEEAIDQILLVADGRAARKNILIRKDIPARLPCIFADHDRLAQILINIIDNALKFTPEGGVISLTAFPEGKEFLALNISDTGPGIPEADIPRLGERFYRVDRTRSRELGGTGLGLSIVKHLMKAHGGRLKIMSILGKGTTVALSFPVFQKTEKSA